MHYKGQSCPIKFSCVTVSVNNRSSSWLCRFGHQVSHDYREGKNSWLAGSCHVLAVLSNYCKQETLCDCQHVCLLLHALQLTSIPPTWSGDITYWRCWSEFICQTAILAEKIRNACGFVSHSSSIGSEVDPFAFGLNCPNWTHLEFTSSLIFGGLIVGPPWIQTPRGSKLDRWNSNVKSPVDSSPPCAKSSPKWESSAAWFSSYQTPQAKFTIKLNFSGGLRHEIILNVATDSTPYFKLRCGVGRWHNKLVDTEYIQA